MINLAHVRMKIRAHIHVSVSDDQIANSDLYAVLRSWRFVMFSLMTNTPFYHMEDPQSHEVGVPHSLDTPLATCKCREKILALMCFFRVLVYV